MGVTDKALSDEEREATRRWLTTWAEVGGTLDAERWSRVAALSDDQAFEQTLSLLRVWEADWAGDDGEGLLRCQDVFSRERNRTSR
jgi:hypothetical protein